MKNTFILLLTVIFVPLAGSAQSFMPSERYFKKGAFFTVHTNARESSEVLYKMDSIVYHKFLPLQKKRKAVYNYNGDGTINSYQIYEDNKVIGNTLYTYSNGRKIQEVFKGVSFIDYIFLESNYTYNTSEQLSTLEIITRDTFGIENSAVRNVYTYDGRGNQVVAMIENRKKNGDWTLSGKRDYHYNSKNQIDSSSESLWHQGKYFIYSYTTFKHEGNKQIEIEYRDETLDNNIEYVPNHMRETDLDINNQPSLAIDYSWDPIASKWIKESKDEYIASTEFNDSNTYSAFTSLDSDFKHGLPLRITTTPWDEESQVYLEASLDMEMFYSKTIITSFYQSATEATFVFPNPAEGMLTIQNDYEGTKKISIANVLGIVVLEKNWEGESYDLAVDNLQSGTYYYTIVSGNKKYFDKLMIK